MLFLFLIIIAAVIFAVMSSNKQPRKTRHKQRLGPKDKRVIVKQRGRRKGYRINRYGEIFEEN